MEDIQKVIADIETRVTRMRNSLSEVKAENSALKSEVERLTNMIGQREEEATDFKKKYDGLLQEYEQLRQAPAKESGVDAVHIDALVREIDECISRLKAN